MIEAAQGGRSRSQIVATAASLAPLIEAAVDTIEASRRFPAELMAGLHRSSILRLLLPRSVDGLEVEPGTYFRAVEELARHDGSVAWNVFVANSSAIIAAFLDSAVAQEIYLDADTVIAWGPPNRCRADALSDGYRVSGEWEFASGCRQANWMGVHCLVTEPGGGVRLNDRAKPTIRTLLFRAEHAELVDNWDTIGLRGTASDGYRVTDLVVPERFSTTREDPDIRRELGPLYAIPMQGLYAVGVAGVAVGLARAMLDECIELAKTKAPRGVVPMAQSASVQGDLAKAEAQLSAAGTWLEHILDEVYDNVSAHPVSSINVQARAQVRLGCIHAIKSSVEVAQTTYRLAGVSAIFKGTPLERRYRDIHTLSQQIQSRHVHFEAVGQVMLGNPPETFY
ncbi:MAG: hypothetical protein HOI95_00645 [Chromatiales bacterium]|jgi:indole-3-acetate monooxygenase|nr:hypothetical protein [Chromatiales bacterium]